MPKSKKNKTTYPALTERINVEPTPVLSSSASTPVRRQPVYVQVADRMVLVRQVLLGRHWINRPRYRQLISPFVLGLRRLRILLDDPVHMVLQSKVGGQWVEVLRVAWVAIEIVDLLAQMSEEEHKRAAPVGVWPVATQQEQKGE